MAYECILKCGVACHSTDTISQNKWDSFSHLHREHIVHLPSLFESTCPDIH